MDCRVVSAFTRVFRRAMPGNDEVTALLTSHARRRDCRAPLSALRLLACEIPDHRAGLVAPKSMDLDQGHVRLIEPRWEKLGPEREQKEHRSRLDRFDGTSIALVESWAFLLSGRISNYEWPSTTLADFSRARDSQITFSVTHG